jgi:hypothetical protein
MHQRTQQRGDRWHCTPLQVRQPWLLIAAGLLALAAAFAAAAGESAAFGFSPAQFPRQQALERRFDAGLNPADLRAWLQRLSSEANHVGSPHDKANAEFVRDLLRQWGWDAQTYDEAYAQVLAGDVKLTAAQRRQVNSLLRGMEQRLTDARGLPGREWFRHFVYAPGRLTGYGVKTLPAVREALDAGRWDEANQYAAITAAVLASYCDRLEELTARLKRGSR